MPGLRDMRDLGQGWRMSTVPRSRSAKAMHRRAVARCQKSADSGSHRRSRSLRLLCRPGEFHSGSTTGTDCVKFSSTVTGLHDVWASMAWNTKRY